ncbi:MAG: methyltransferase [Muribaculaceae bacterium]|nr:methyltransferase [Muribaculaceae bacterium]
MGRERTFRFKQFAVLNEQSGLKVGTDGVLVGAWAKVERSRHILDVGTGCGLIALMVAQRNSECSIKAIDIDEIAVNEARYNVSQSPCSERIEVMLADFNTLIEESGEQFDHIISNPPFFVNSLLPPQESKAKAKHGVSLSFEKLISGAKKLLVECGRLSIITPADCYEQIIAITRNEKMNVSRLTKVIPVEGHEAKRILWEIVKGEAEIEESELTIENAERTYTEEYKKLCCEFYLKF